MKLKTKEKSFEVPDVKISSELGKIKGLMFIRKGNAKPLLFSFPKQTSLAIHSFFVFFPFLAVWLDDKDNIMEIKTIKPFIPYIKPKKNFYKLLEIPINKKYEETARNIVASF